MKQKDACSPYPQKELEVPDGSANDNRKLTAVVLSGGGANGAYEVGILKALCNGRSPTTNYQPLEPDIFAGTSIGSFNAAFLVSQWDQYGSTAVANLERFWLDRLTGGFHNNGVFRLRGNPRELLDVPSLISKPVGKFQQFLMTAAFSVGMRSNGASTSRPDATTLSRSG